MNAANATIVDPRRYIGLHQDRNRDAGYRKRFGQDADLTGLGNDPDKCRISIPELSKLQQRRRDVESSSSTVTLGLSSNSTLNFGALSGVSGATFRQGGSFTPRRPIGALNTDSTFAGKITGSISITKVGTGTQTFSGSGNTYTRNNDSLPGNASSPGRRLSPAARPSMCKAGRLSMCPESMAESIHLPPPSS